MESKKQNWERGRKAQISHLEKKTTKKKKQQKKKKTKTKKKQINYSLMWRFL